jgi:hypothetical protein
MRNVPNISSEEELLQLRNDGKISEAEYQELLATIKKASLSKGEKLAPEIDKAESKRKLGKRAFILMLLGIILPIVWFMFMELLVASDPNTHAAIGPSFFLGLTLEIAAFVMGVVSWPDDYSKAATIASGIVIVITILLIILR